MQLSNFGAYHALFPEYRVAFLGDSGQGDLLFGLQLAAAAVAAGRASATAMVVNNASTEEGVAIKLPTAQVSSIEIEASSSASRTEPARRRNSSCDASSTITSDATVAVVAVASSSAVATLTRAPSAAAISTSAPISQIPTAGLVTRRAPRPANNDAGGSWRALLPSALSPQRRVLHAHAAPRPGVSVGGVLSPLPSYLTHDAVIGATPPPGAAGSPPAPLLAACPPPLVLIHDICRASQAPLIAHGDRARLRARGVTVFDSYIEAAAVAFDAGIVAPDAVLATIEDAAAALAAIRFGSETQRLRRLTEFSHAVQFAQLILAQRGAHAAAQSVAGNAMVIVGKQDGNSGVAGAAQTYTAT